MHYFLYYFRNYAALGQSHWETTIVCIRSARCPIWPSTLSLGPLVVRERFRDVAEARPSSIWREYRRALLCNKTKQQKTKRWPRMASDGLRWLQMQSERPQPASDGLRRPQMAPDGLRWPRQMASDGLRWRQVALHFKLTNVSRKNCYGPLLG